MTAEDFVDRVNALGSVDLFAGGTPCTSFSLAGLRGSLSDPRGGLALRFVQLVHEIKSDEKQGVKIAVWENVPGCLSTADNAFGCFLAGLVGAERPLVPCDRDGAGADKRLVRRCWSLDKKSGQWRCRWPRAGMVVGPRRSAAWRVIDGQGFVPQRRERVFLVSFRTEDGVNPSAVLHEPEADPLAYLAGLGGPSLFPVPKGVPGHPAPGEPERQTVAALTADGVGASGVDSATGNDVSNDAVGADVRPFAFERRIARCDRGRPSWVVPTLTRAQRSPGSDGRPFVVTAAGVRHLTSSEVERLMGFEDGFTEIAWRGRPPGMCPENRRYAALANSMIRHVMWWIGVRIEMVRRLAWDLWGADE